MNYSTDPVTPDFADTHEWITAYLTVHSLSVPSRRYSIILWLIVLAVFLTVTIIHWSGLRGEYLGSVFSKWTLQRRTVRFRPEKSNSGTGNQFTLLVDPLPSNAQLLAVFALTFVTLILAFAGPDYLDPSLKIFQIQSRSYSTSTFVPYMPQYTISKSHWSTSARTGQIAFALFPLCVLFALKAPPFAIFAISFMTQMYFDKLAFLHKWTARLIWFLVFIHVIAWSIQLAKDIDPSTGRVAYVYAWSYTPFRFGWAAFILLTLIISLSLRPLRKRSYEYFYVFHVLLVPLMLLTAGLHHPTVAWWCWIALSIWIAERLWRATWWMYANISTNGSAAKRSDVSSDSEPKKSLLSDNLEMHHLGRPSTDSHLLPPAIDERVPSPLAAHYLSSTDPEIPTNKDNAALSVPRLRHSYVPPPGYAHVELLSGSTMRLRLITPGFLSWSPGQHFLLNIPSVSRFTSHPFTCASICDTAEHSGAGRIMLFLIGCKEGWTKDLWNHVSRLSAERSRGDVPPMISSSDLPARGVLLRAYVDGPFGTVARVRWGNYSTAVIVVGGAGVSVGLSLLQYFSMCLAGRDGRQLGARPGGWGRKDTILKRVRFIWIVREHSYIQWCASVIRYCMSIVPPSDLQVNIYVTNFKPILSPIHAYVSPSNVPPAGGTQPGEPPRPHFVREKYQRSRSRSVDSIESHESDDSDVDLSYYVGEHKDEHTHIEDLRAIHDEYIRCLTNFIGHVDMAALAGETHLNRKLKKEGQLRRRESRRRSIKHTEGDDFELSQHSNDETQFFRGRGSNSDLRTTHSRTIPVLESCEEETMSTYSADTLRLLSRRSSQWTLCDPVLSPPDGFARANSSPDTGKHNGKSDSMEKFRRGKPNSDNNHDSYTGFELDEQEMRDLRVLSEYTKPGRPALRKVIANEMDMSQESLVVACCGPVSMTAEIRQVVASLINPEQIRRGETNGSITLISEEFDY